MKPEVISSTLLHQHESIQFLAQQIRLPDGKIIDKALIHHPGSVAIVPLTNDGQVVLIRQFRQALDADLLEIPAGTCHPDEDPRLCAERELQEEAGYFPETLLELANFFIAPGHTNEYMHLYLARDLRPSRLSMDEDEIIETVPLPFSEALDLVKNHQIRDGKTILGLLLASSIIR